MIDYKTFTINTNKLIILLFNNVFFQIVLYYKFYKLL